MPTIKRKDGAQFVVHTYREFLTVQKFSFVKKEIQLLAQNHGEYVRLFKHNHRNIEAIFSHDSGYLLAETVWQFFKKPSDLIYCEALPESQQILVVVIKANTVYLDTKIPYQNVLDEFNSLTTTGAHSFDIFIVGDVPVSNEIEERKFFFAPSFVKSFNKLNDSILQQLPIDPALQLQPLEEALGTIKNKDSARNLLLLSLILLSLVAWWYFQATSPETTVQPKAPAKVVQPIAAINLLNSPAPDLQLKEMAKLIVISYGMPGWIANKISLQDHSYSIVAGSLGGTYSILQQWADTNNMQMVVTNNGPLLTVSSKLPNRSVPSNIPNIQTLLMNVVDSLNKLLPGSGTVQIGTIDSLSIYKTANLTVQLTNISPDILSLIGIQLRDFPVVIEQVDLNYNQGLLSGTVKLKVIGM